VGYCCFLLKTLNSIVFSRLEKEIDVTRRNFSREMLLNKTLTIQNEGLKRANDELASRNEILVNSHYMFEEKWTKIVNAFEFYKDYYKRHVDMISSRKSPQSPNRSALPSDVSLILSHDNLFNKKKTFSSSFF
jgi:hypothetical protein